MASYFWLSIIFLTLQILRHPLCQHDLPQPSCKGSHNHHWLYPIPIAPLAQYHVGDLPYDLWTTLLYFPFLVSFLLPDICCHGLTDHRSSHLAIRTICFATHKPCAHFTYCLYLRLLYLLWKTRKLSPELRLKFVSSYHFTLLRLASSLHFTLSTHFALSHCTKPPSHTTLHSLILHQETIPLLSNRTPQNHIGHTLKSPSPLICVAS